MYMYADNDHTCTVTRTVVEVSVMISDRYM